MHDTLFCILSHTRLSLNIQNFKNLMSGLHSLVSFVRIKDEAFSLVASRPRSTGIAISFLPLCAFICCKSAEHDTKTRVHHFLISDFVFFVAVSLYLL
jgi:hypothetical protein